MQPSISITLNNLTLEAGQRALAAVTACVNETPLAATAPVSKPKAEKQAEAPTLADVRAKLAALSKSGKADQVKALIAQFGVTKLTDVAAERYTEVLQAAEAL